MRYTRTGKQYDIAVYNNSFSITTDTWGSRRVRYSIFERTSPY
jgi:hypothetical protein